MTRTIKPRSLRNLVARALMEGYDETVEQMRFALLSADIALDAIPVHACKTPDGWVSTWRRAEPCPHCFHWTCSCPPVSGQSEKTGA